MDYNLYLNLFLVLPALFIAHADVSQPHNLIWRHLLDNYDNRVRPVVHPDTVLNVSLNLHVNNVIDLNAKSQILIMKLWIVMYWNDEFLKFNASYYGHNYVAGSRSDIWVPDIVLHDSMDEEHPGIIDHPIFRLHHSGQIKWVPVVITMSACKLNVVDYPFDTQVCPLTFGTWVHANNDIHLIWNNTLYNNRVFVTSGEWDVSPLQCYVEEVEYGKNAMFDLLRCHLIMTRKPLHYIFNLVLPCLILLMVGSFTFLLPVNSGEKVTLSVTILLALTVFVLVLMENLPANSDGIPFLGKFITACIILLAVSTAMAVSVVNMVAMGNEEIGGSLPPYWLEVLVLTCLRKIVCYSAKNVQETAIKAQNLAFRRRSSYFHESNHNNHFQTQQPQYATTTKKEKSFQLWIEIATVLDRLYLMLYLSIVIAIIATVVVYSRKGQR